MAMKTCKDCGNAMSVNAKTCPKCGAPAPKGTSRITLLLGGLFIIFVGQAVYSSLQRSSSSPATEPQVPVSAEERAALDRAAQDKAAGDRRRGLIAQAAKTLRAGMHDPASFDLVDAQMMGDQAGCYTYRAKNGFGALRAGSAVLTPDNRFLASDSPGFATAWKKHCSGQSGQSLTAYVRMFVL